MFPVRGEPWSARINAHDRALWRRVGVCDAYRTRVALHVLEPERKARNDRPAEARHTRQDVPHAGSLAQSSFCAELLSRLVACAIRPRGRTRKPHSRTRGGSLEPTVQTCTTLFADREASVLPSGENATESTTFVFPTSTRRGALEPTVHTRTTSEPEAIVLPSGENATELTEALCPSRTRGGALEASVHTRTVFDGVALMVAGVVAANPRACAVVPKGPVGRRSHANLRGPSGERAPDGQRVPADDAHGGIELGGAHRPPPRSLSATGVEVPVLGGVGSGRSAPWSWYRHTRTAPSTSKSACEQPRSRARWARRAWTAPGRRVRACRGVVAGWAGGACCFITHAPSIRRSSTPPVSTCAPLGDGGETWLDLRSN